MTTADAQYGAGGPVFAAQTWVALVLDRKDLRQAWPLTTPELREALVCSWADANAGHPDVAVYDPAELLAALSAAHPTHRLWDGFAHTLLADLADTWSNIDLATWGWASRPRPVSLDVEIALLVDAGGPTVMDRGSVMPALGFVMHHVPGTGWLVAGFEGRSA